MDWHAQMMGSCDVLQPKLTQLLDIWTTLLPLLCEHYVACKHVWIHNLESSKIMFVVGQLWGMWLPWCQPKVFWMPYRSCSNTLPVSSFRRSAQYWKDHSFLNHFINYVYHDPYVCSVITICVYWWQGLNMNDEVHCSETNAYHFIWFKKLWAAQLFCSW